jgi:hypothetical protein
MRAVHGASELALHRGRYWDRTSDLLGVNEWQESLYRSLVQFRGLLRSYEVGAGWRGCCTYLLYRCPLSHQDGSPSGSNDDPGAPASVNGLPHAYRRLQVSEPGRARVRAAEWRDVFRRLLLRIGGAVTRTRRSAGGLLAGGGGSGRLGRSSPGRGVSRAGQADRCARGGTPGAGLRGRVAHA